MISLLQWAALPVLLLGVCALAWVLDARAERYAGALILLANCAADVLLACAYPRFPSAAMCLVDFLLACGLLAVALRFANYWLGLAMLLQSAALCLQALDLAGDGPSVLVHIIANNLISYGMLACLLAGVLGAWWSARRRPGASDRAASAARADALTST